MALAPSAFTVDDEDVNLLQPRDYRAFVEVTPPTRSLGAVLLSYLANLRGSLPLYARALYTFFCTLMPWVRSYDLKKAGRDLTAACVVTALLIPQTISYGNLVGVKPANSLYAAVLPIFVAAILTSTGKLQWGLVAPTSILANSMGRAITSAPDKSPEFIAVQVQLALTSGIILLAMFTFRMAWIADLISQPVILGFS